MWIPLVTNSTENREVRESVFHFKRGITVSIETSPFLYESMLSPLVSYQCDLSVTTSSYFKFGSLIAIKTTSLHAWIDSHALSF